MFLLVISLASLVCQPGAGASEKETTRGLLYLQKYGYLSPRNQTAALTTSEGLQERQTTSIIQSKHFNISESGATILNTAVKGTIVAKRNPIVYVYLLESAQT